MQSFLQIIEIIKDFKQIKLDKDVAELLALQAKQVALWKTRGKVPYEAIIAFCNAECLSVYDLLFEGKITRTEVEQKIIKWYRKAEDANPLFAQKVVADFELAISDRLDQYSTNKPEEVSINDKQADPLGQ